MNRYLKLACRHLAARKLGFGFWGRTKTTLPSSVRFNGRQIPLAYPDDGGYMSDIINLWLDDEYGLKQLESEPKTIVDIGANIGLFSLWAWHRFPKANVHAYEPNPRVIDFAKQNLQPSGATLFPTAVSDKEGTCSLVDDRESRMASVDATGGGDVRVIAFEDVLKTAGGEIDLLKMDCEGGEWDIVQAEDCFASVGKIRMEFHLAPDRTLQDLRSAADRIGFKIDHQQDHGGFGIAWLTNPNHVTAKN